MTYCCIAFSSSRLSPPCYCCVAACPCRQAVRRLWALISHHIESAVSRQPERPRASVESEVKGRYLVLDTKQRGLSLSQEGMALLFNLLLQEPEVVFRSVGAELLFFRGGGVVGGAARVEWKRDSWEGGI